MLIGHEQITLLVLESPGSDDIFDSNTFIASYLYRYFLAMSII